MGLSRLPWNSQKFERNCHFFSVIGMLGGTWQYLFRVALHRKTSHGRCRVQSARPPALRK